MAWAENCAKRDVASAEKCEGGVVRWHRRMARYTYLETPDLLSPEPIARFETRWQFDALHEQGGMSHPPRGFIYTPFGPASPNEVLLELPTSE